MCYKIKKGFKSNTCISLALQQQAQTFKVGPRIKKHKICIGKRNFTQYSLRILNPISFVGFDFVSSRLALPII
jgi:hypothetical protein